MHLRRLATLFAVAFLALTACGDDGGDYAVVVNGTRLSPADVDGELEAMKANKAFLSRLGQLQGRPAVDERGELAEDVVAMVVNRHVAHALVQQEIRHRGLVVAEADVDRADVAERYFDSTDRTPVYDGFPEHYRRTLARRSAEVSALQAAIGNIDASDAAVERHYQAHGATLTRTCVSHILVDTQEKASELRAEVVGGRPFADVATASSMDIGPEGSASKGGSLGCLRPEQSGGNFKAAMDSLDVGELSHPVRTDLGFHLVLVTDRRQPSPAEAAPAIRRQLLQPAQAAYQAFLEEALANAEVKVNPRYGRFEKTPDTGRLPGPTPPGAGGRP